MSATLRLCPECGAEWPKRPDYALRGCSWLNGLSRSISPSNNDVDIHDGVHGRNRFLRLELKTSREQWPPQPGQLWLLKALASQGNWTVLILRGDARRLDVHQVRSSGIEPGVPSHVEAVRAAVDAWLRGSLWRDAAQALSARAPIDGTHVHGWARVDGLWTCVQDHYAVGRRPETGCGETLAMFP